MRNSIKLSVVLIGGLLAAALLLSCASTAKAPIFADAELSNMMIQDISLLPIVDRRVDKSYEMNTEGSIGDKVEKQLRSKGYTVQRLAAFSDSFAISNEEVAEMKTEEMTVLGNNSSEYLMVVYLDDASSKTALGYSFKVECTAVLVDKHIPSMVWKDKGIGSQGQGGAIGCLMSGAVKGEALNACVKSMLSSLPDSAEKMKKKKS